jgi:hypothetical protein
LIIKIIFKKKKVYEFNKEIEKNHEIKWEDFITDEFINSKEKVMFKTIEFKMDRNVEK